jgi:hypothetical protein
MKMRVKPQSITAAKAIATATVIPTSSTKRFPCPITLVQNDIGNAKTKS